MKRVFLIVLDSFGIGQMPDSEAFGDVNVNTLASCAASGVLNIPNMVAAGLGNILQAHYSTSSTGTSSAAWALRSDSFGGVI